MRKYLKVIVIMLSLIGLSCAPPAQRSETSGSNPPGSQLVKYGIVLPVGSTGEWDAGMVESPSVWHDVNRRMYGMVYTGYGSSDSTRRGYKFVTRPQVGLAWSDDLLHWKKDPRNPILTGSGIAGSSDVEGATGPFIWYENGTYFLFYIGTTVKGYEKGSKTLNVSTSTDLYSWKRSETNPIIAPFGNGWRRDAIWHPNVVKVGDQYYLFFNASGVVNGLQEEFIGYATSKDLLHWEVDDVNSPLVVGSARPGAWDASGRAGDPSVYKVGNTWYMAWYSWDKKNSADGLAWTTEEQFPLGWRNYEHNPVLRIGEPGSYDALHAGKPFIFLANDTLYHFYTAVALDETRQIALAVSPMKHK
ncbi:MAG: hypothetical protein HW389_3272 [Bacteroidetes bacterium]|nr:hypothetical protein [Bacteroidota bacterium]